MFEEHIIHTCAVVPISAAEGQQRLRGRVRENGVNELRVRVVVERRLGHVVDV
jgi:hypothetical protein